MSGGTASPEKPPRPTYIALTSARTVPIAVSASAAAAGLAYLNARSTAWYDFRLLRALAGSALPMFINERRGRLNVFYVLESRAQSTTTANRPFLLFGDRSYTYADVYDRALRCGTWLRETMGVKEKEIVAIDSMNSDNYLFLWFGLWAIGATPAFINYNLLGDALVHCVKRASSRLLFVDPAAAESITTDVRDKLPGVSIQMMDQTFEADIVATEPVRYPDEVRHANSSADIAILIYTSGTTGLPKAAVVSWGKVVVASGFVPVWAKLKPTDVYYTVSWSLVAEPIALVG